MSSSGKQHRYAVKTRWTGNRGSGTSSYRDYSRDHEVRMATKPDQVLPGSADQAFRGDPARFNPEELLLAALSQCHMLSYLHACVLADVTVVAYTDDATATMITEVDGSGRFTEAMLNPRVTISADSDPEQAMQAHETAHRMCFIANSVNFEVRHHPAITVAG
ncbi:OsmC family peroxiredoxin [Microlunatus elymi]|uniref:OsmC family peroxiredoxin n=1 Tax=Microlunatus elymi TaxID=2596828 RepID=A0A516Q0I6_9ACTN|nr:OsmC family protein [Microlunatus elymi]QDP96956.1 OsmC family peroxiredoxin [Microlunatus elymi]